MSGRHRLIGTESPGGLLFECESCGRRLVVDGESGEMVIVDHGDRAALHRGAMGGVKLQVEKGL
ncbi:hypothetical protein HH310_14880 [Actinoplanes sp. TBRC 11911]|uniref:hypothetical protein n=1 Tax=Actinoplanes sp. TBRC 11911 TaxID=2729386 RepID=UPI00145CB19C|nr:hypothetical protein [Actinoplanes sp. TBRC 11911]NMO52472.1 hypothetical protein [Actinoplanes sp. TBRC 11911]